VFADALKEADFSTLTMIWFLLEMEIMA